MLAAVVAGLLIGHAAAAFVPARTPCPCLTSYELGTVEQAAEEAGSGSFSARTTDGKFGVGCSAHDLTLPDCVTNDKPTYCHRQWCYVNQTCYSKYNLIRHHGHAVGARSYQACGELPSGEWVASKGAAVDPEGFRGFALDGQPGQSDLSSVSGKTIGKGVDVSVCSRRHPTYSLPE